MSKQERTWLVGDETDGLPATIRWPVTDGRRRFNLYTCTEAEALRNILNDLEARLAATERERDDQQGENVQLKRDMAALQSMHDKDLDRMLSMHRDKMQAAEALLAVVEAKAALADEIAVSLTRVEGEFMESTSYILSVASKDWLNRYNSIKLQGV
jgi:hypothetical protein